MNTIGSIAGAMLAATLAGTLATGCATVSHETVKAEASQALAAPATEQAAPGAASAALASSAAGDDWTAANLFEQAAAGFGSPTNRFNLAAAYEKTGRLTQAATLYRTVVRDGQFTTRIEMPTNADRGAPIQKINLADEAQTRLVPLNRQIAEQDRAARRSRVAPAPRTRTVRGKKVVVAAAPAPRVATASGRGKISDAQAKQMDAAVDAAILREMASAR